MECWGTGHNVPFWLVGGHFVSCTNVDWTFLGLGLMKEEGNLAGEVCLISR
jgi:hypothetical protein